MKKKAIVLNFLITLILAIIIFVPACVMVNKLFTPADSQAKDSFLSLAKEIKKVASTVNGQGSYMLIMEPGTVIVGFTKDTFKHCLREGKLDTCETWKRPTDSECSSGSCVCLIKDFSPKTST